MDFPGGSSGKEPVCQWNRHFILFHSLVIIILFFNKFTYFNWRLVTLQYCCGFCHTLTWISHRYTFFDYHNTFFSFIFISWRLITSQHCHGFCHTLTWISHGVTCIPHPDPPTHLPLHPIPLGLPSATGPSTCLMHPTWACGISLIFLLSFLIWFESSLFFLNLTKDLSLFKKQALSFIDFFFFCFLWSFIYLHSDLCYFLPSAIFGLNLFFFLNSFFMCKFRLLFIIFLFLNVSMNMKVTQ